MKHLKKDWPLYAVILIGILLIAVIKAHADVTICKAAKHDSAEATCTAESVATVANGNDPVLWCNSGATDGAPRSSCVTRKWYFEKYLPDYARVLTTTAGWQQWSKAKTMWGTTPPPTCPPPQPPADTQTAVCPLPTTGTFLQARSYSCVAPNWVAGPWTPATPPPGACATPPPPKPTISAFAVSPSSAGVPYTATAKWASDAYACSINGLALPAPVVAASGTAVITVKEIGLRYVTLECWQQASREAFSTQVFAVKGIRVPTCLWAQSPKHAWWTYSSTGAVLPDKVFFGWWCQEPTGWVIYWRVPRISNLEYQLEDIEKWDQSRVTTEWLSHPPVDPTADEIDQWKRFYAQGAPQ